MLRAIVDMYNPANVAISGGTIAGISSLELHGTGSNPSKKIDVDINGRLEIYNNIGAVMTSITNAGLLTTATINSSTQYNLSGNIIFSSAAPTINSGFGTSPSIVSSNGSATFSVNVGTGGSASSGVITMPAATAGWNCVINEPVPQALNRTVCTANSPTSITLTNINLSTGNPTAWPGSYNVQCLCFGF